MEEMKFTPNYKKAEFHLTYRCTLGCKACSRASFLSQPHTEDMTLEDAKEFVRQAEELKWIPDAMIIIGGEPTLHPDFFEFIELIRPWIRQDLSRYIQIFSNGSTPKTREALDKARIEQFAAIFTDEWKTDPITQKKDSKAEWDINTFVSPKDAGLEFTGVCYAHSSWCCGVGVDHTGYSPCPIGMSIVKLLGINGTTTKNLADLFDNDKAREMTLKQCEHCGFMFPKRKNITRGNVVSFEKYAASCPRIRGMRVSPTWQKIFKEEKMKDVTKRWKEE